MAVLGFGRIHARYIGHYSLHSSSEFAWVITFVFLLGVSAYGAGLPDLVESSESSFLVSASAAAVGAVVISILQLALGSQLLPRFIVASSAVALVPWYMLCAAVASRGRDRDERRDRVVAIVGAEEAAMLTADLGRAPEHPASLVRVVPPEPVVSEAPWAEPIVDLAIEDNATVLVLDREAQALDAVVSQAATLHEAGVRVRTLALFYDEWLGKLPMSELERVSLMFDIGELHRDRYGRFKRLFDVTAASAGLVVLLVLLPFVAVGDVLGNRGPIFYLQPRIGRNGAPFSMLKLRTMRPGSRSGEWTAHGDDRITPVGRWLRKTHIDELPQVINILRGELSIVGPRPEQPQYVSELTEKIPFYQLRHLVRPGLTGWAQVKYQYGSSAEDAIEKLQYEFYYLRHQSLMLDARIIGRTVRSVLRGSGR